MTKSDFQKGQTVYLFIVQGSNAYRYVKDKPFVERIVPATVVSVGKKYISVAPTKYPNGEKIRFNVEENFNQEVTAGSIDYRLFLSAQEICDDQESEILYDFIATRFNSYRNSGKYSLETLRKIKEILEDN